MEGHTLRSTAGDALITPGFLTWPETKCRSQIWIIQAFYTSWDDGKFFSELQTYFPNEDADIILRALIAWDWRYHGPKCNHVTCLYKTWAQKVVAACCLVPICLPWNKNWCRIILLKENSEQKVQQKPYKIACGYTNQKPKTMWFWELTSESSRFFDSLKPWVSTLKIATMKEVLKTSQKNQPCSNNDHDCSKTYSKILFWMHRKKHWWTLYQKKTNPRNLSINPR